MSWLNLYLWLVILCSLAVALFAAANWMDRRKDVREAVTRQRVNMATARTRFHIPPTQYVCAPDGVAITSLDRLRDTIMLYDRLLTYGDLHGRHLAPPLIDADAVRFVREFSPDPERGAFLLEQCLGWLAREYPAGYNALYHAFTQAAGDAAKPVR
jgi:hypothetical protein